MLRSHLHHYPLRQTGILAERIIRIVHRCLTIFAGKCRGHFKLMLMVECECANESDELLYSIDVNG